MQRRGAWLLVLVAAFGCGDANRLEGPNHRADGPPWIAAGAAGQAAALEVEHRVLLIGDAGLYLEDDATLAALGAWLGWKMLPVIILMSAVVGAATGIMLIVSKRHERSAPIPFGPYLAAAGWIAMLWGPDIVNWYLDLMS